jgi:hypothetical protein
MGQFWPALAKVAEGGRRRQKEKKSDTFPAFA